MKRWIGSMAAACVMAAMCTVTMSASVSAGPKWAPAASAAIHPGVATMTRGGIACTANFVFTDKSSVYIGQAGDCSTPNTVNGCSTTSQPPGTPVKIAGASRPGVIAYDSFTAMRAAHESDKNTCSENDFALVRIDPRDRGRVNPSLPQWGGPIGIDDQINQIETIYASAHTSNTSGRTVMPSSWGEVVLLAPLLGEGDLGSPVVSHDGSAMGVVTCNPRAYGCMVDLPRVLAYMKAHVPSLRSVQLVNGTAPFSG